MRAVTREVHDPTYGYDEEVLRYEVDPGGADSEELEQALVAYERACLPMPDQWTNEELAKLKARTVSRQQDQEELSLMLRVYADDLAEWPADVVKEVLRTQPKVSKFWPTWYELEERLKLKAWKRLKKRDALRRAVS